MSISEIHDRNTRHNHNLYLPSTNLTVVLKGILYSGSKIYNHLPVMLCLWFRASLICINNCAKRCNTKQSIYYYASSLYTFRVSTTPIIRNTQNCNYSLRYWSYFLFSYLALTWPSFAMLEGKNMTSTGGCTYSFVYS